MNKCNVYYEITNEKSGLSKRIKAEDFSSIELAKIAYFYEKIGFKVKILSFKSCFFQKKGLENEEK